MADIAIQAQAQDINFVTKFEGNLQHLLEVMGKSDVTVLPNGHTMNIYKTSGTLSATAVAEAAEIPVSTYAATLDKTVELTFSKYRKLTGIESISSKGYDVAVGATDEAMLRDVQKGVRKSIYAAIATGTGTAKGATFQAALANTWAALDKVHEDEDVTPVYFVNPTDVASLLGTGSYQLATAFGMSYVQNFLGLGNVIVDSNVEAGKVYGTASENLDIVAADVSGIEGLDMVTDGSGIIAVHNGAKYENGAIQTVVYSGLSVFPVYLDRVIVGTIGA